MFELRTLFHVGMGSGVLDSAPILARGDPWVFYTLFHDGMGSGVSDSAPV